MPGMKRKFSGVVKKVVRSLVKKRKIVRARKSMRSARVGRVPVHSFTRMVDTKTITLANNTNFIGTAYTFKFDDLPNVSEFTSLFDQYKLYKITVYFKLHTNSYIGFNTQVSAWAAYGGPTTFPTMYICNDHDDGNTPTLSELKQRSQTRRYVLAPNRIVKWTVRPSVLTQMYRTAVTTGYAPKYNQFLDIANSDIPHYGCKIGVDYDGFTLPAISGSQGQDITVNVEMKYHFVCKDVR